MDLLRPGIHPLWFWNTAMDAERIQAQLRALAAGGCRGALISPRQGFPDAYLSERWFGLVAEACRAGAALGLEIGVADEFPYPSGNAGGLVTLGHPERWATALTQVELICDGGAVSWDLPAGAVLDCAAFPLLASGVAWNQRRDLVESVGIVFRRQTYRETERDLSAYNGRRFFACDPAPRLEAVLPPGRWLLTAAVQTVYLHHKYVGPTADTLDPEAMAAFLAVTHRRYEGVPLRALFVDEIDAARWSRHLPACFREQTGEDLGPLLPALVRDDHPRAAALRAAITGLRVSRFRRIFLDPVRAWCRQHRVVLCEERPMSRLDDAGADIPGCEPGHTRVGAERHDLLQTNLRGNARAAAAAAHEGAALCECGHSLGWGATLEDLRAMADNLLLQGITHLLPHAAYASTAALRKHDAPPSFFIQQSWWGLHHHLATRVERILGAFAGTKPEIELLVPPGTSEELQHRMCALGYAWSFADDAPAADLTALPPPRRAPWSSDPKVDRRVRSGGGRTVALLLNHGRTDAVIALPAGWQPLDLDGAAPEAVAGGWRLEPFQAMLAAEGAAPPPALPHVAIAWPERWQVSSPAGNLLRLGRWQLAIAGQQAETTHFPLSEQLIRTGLRFAPHIEPGFGTPPLFSLPPLACTYRTRIRNDQAGPVRLLMEPDTLLDPGWTIRVNAGPALRADAFTATTGLPGESLGVDIQLQPGWNDIVIDVTASRTDGGLRNPLYLQGAFAVATDSLAPPIASAPFADLAAAGRTHAAGVVDWSAEIVLPAASGRSALCLPQLQTDAFEVALDDGPWLPVAWAPRRVVLPGWTPGRHRLRIRQHLPPARCFHGETWDAAAHRVIPIPPGGPMCAGR